MDSSNASDTSPERSIKSYSNNSTVVTTSILPATTLNTINVKLNDDLNIIDTPGLIYSENYLTNAEVYVVKKITPNKEIKPRTYQMKPNQSIIIENYGRIDYLSDHKNSFTLYISNDVKVNRIKLNTNDYLRDLQKYEFNTVSNKDIVIDGLCFLKMVNPAIINVYTKEKVNVFERNNLI